MLITRRNAIKILATIPAFGLGAKVFADQKPKYPFDFDNAKTAEEVLRLLDMKYYAAKYHYTYDSLVSFWEFNCDCGHRLDVTCLPCGSTDNKPARFDDDSLFVQKDLRFMIGSTQHMCHFFGHKYDFRKMRIDELRKLISSNRISDSDPILLRKVLTRYDKFRNWRLNHV